jgi:hypothetical protein
LGFGKRRSSRKSCKISNAKVLQALAPLFDNYAENNIGRKYRLNKTKMNMETLLLSAIIGVVAGIIDIIPMVIQKLDKRATISAILQYFFVSIIIVNIDLPHIVWWLQGGLISVALALPVVVLVSAQDRKAVPVILTMAAILGTLIGVAGHYLT